MDHRISGSFVDGIDGFPKVSMFQAEGGEVIFETLKYQALELWGLGIRGIETRHQAWQWESTLHGHSNRKLTYSKILLNFHYYV